MLFKQRKNFSSNYDIGKPLFNLDLEIINLNPVNPINILLGTKKDVMISLNKKNYSFNNLIAYSVAECVFSDKLLVSEKGYVSRDWNKNVKTRNASLKVFEPSNIDALIDWNNLFKFIEPSIIYDESFFMENAVSQLEYLLKEDYKGLNVHAHEISTGKSDGEIITFEIDTKHNSLIRINEIYEVYSLKEELKK